MAADGHDTSAELACRRRSANNSRSAADLAGQVWFLSATSFSAARLDCLAAKHDNIVGQKSRTRLHQFVDKVMAGKAIVSPPFPSIAMFPDEWGQLATGVPTMFAAAPVYDDAGKPAAVLGLRHPARKGFHARF